tara:strand:+ start:256 stop:543 length:288 start_codon:yes stop_codon:yes gene_type:complete
MTWVPQCVLSLNRALLGDLHAWEVYEQTDPLKRILHLRFHRRVRKEEVPLLRELLKLWCEVNDCVYRKSEYKGYDFKAVILLKGLGPEKNETPFS